MFKRLDMNWWNQSTDVLDVEGSLSGNPVCSEKLFDGGTQELVVNEEFERLRLFRLQEIVHKG